MNYQREVKEARPVLAICYDFDKTLSPTDMQAQGYIQSLGIDVDDFWRQCNKLAHDNEMDSNLAYMYMMVKGAKGHEPVTKESLMEYGSKVEFFPGVETWFERIRSYGEEHGVCVEHYIISSGLKEMIEGTGPAKEGAFKKIYASSFYFAKSTNADGNNNAEDCEETAPKVAVWPAQAVNYTNKTQFLFRIEKGVLDINDPGVNEYFTPDRIRVPFRNMVYIGDSDTDVPCMKLVNSYGGSSIGVYDQQSKAMDKVLKMLRDNRIRYFAPADYTEGSELDQLVKAIIERTAKNDVLEETYYRCLKESQEKSECSFMHENE